MKARRFEFVAGRSSKFWEIAIDQTTVRVRFGRIGSEGTIQNKPLDTPAAARRQVDRLIAEKTRKGYREVQAV